MAPLFPSPRLVSLTAIVFYQGILGAVAHIWWYEAVRVVGPSQAAIFTNLQPIIGIVLARSCSASASESGTWWAHCSCWPASA